MSEWTGKVALVTGVSRGIGRAVALALARAGADVAVSYRTEDGAAREVCAEIEHLNHRGLAVRADASAAGEVAWMVGAVEQVLGPVDVLVNNVGVTRP